MYQLSWSWPITILIITVSDDITQGLTILFSKKTWATYIQEVWVNGVCVHVLMVLMPVGVGGLMVFFNLYFQHIYHHILLNIIIYSITTNYNLVQTYIYKVIIYNYLIYQLKRTSVWHFSCVQLYIVLLFTGSLIH